jgi:ABC-type multidrug transport system fused ATPase/permease subunit
MQNAEIVRAFVREHWPLVVVHVLLVVAAPLAETLALPALYGRMTDAMRTPKDTVLQQRLLVTLCAVVFGIHLVLLLRDHTTQRLSPLMDGFLKVEALQRFLRSENTQCGTTSTGDTVYLLSVLSELSTTWLTWMNDFVLPYATMFSVALVMFLRYDLWIGLAFGTFVAMVLLIMLAVPQRCAQQSQRYSAHMADVHIRVEDLITNRDTIQMYGTHDRELNRLRGAFAGNHYAHVWDVANCSRVYKILLVPLLLGMICMFLVRSRRLLARGSVSHQHFVTVFFVLVGLMGSVFWFTETMSEIVLDVGHLSNLANGLDPRRPPLEIPRAAPPVRPPEGAVGLWRVAFRHRPADPPILWDLNLTVQRGERVALVGPVGSGKSTALRILAGFCTPQSGDAFLDGQWYADLDRAAVHAAVGYVPQTPVLFRDTMLRNVMYGMKEPGDEAAVRAFVRQWAGDRYADRLDDDVGPFGRNLSGGQRQLVWCLRMLLQPPRVILMDEPTAAMDEETKDVLMRLLDALMGSDRSVVIVTHDPYLKQRCSRTVTLPLPDRSPDQSAE